MGQENRSTKAIWTTWDKAEKLLFIPEEIAASNARVAKMSKKIEDYRNRAEARDVERIVANQAFEGQICTGKDKAAYRRISRTTVTVDDGTAIPVARGKYDDINRAFILRN